MKKTLSVLAAIVFPLAAFAADPPYDPSAPPDAFQLGIATNLPIGDSVINFSNAGTTGAGAFGFSFNTVDSICANTYVFDPSAQMVECCACRVEANGLYSYSAKNDLISNTISGGVPTSIVVKFVATEPVKKGLSLTCDPGVQGKLAGGLSVWATALHAAPTTPVSYTVTDSPFHNKVLSQTEYAKLTLLCTFIEGSGSGFGICKGCRLGGL